MNRERLLWLLLLFCLFVSVIFLYPLLRIQLFRQPLIYKFQHAQYHRPPPEWLSGQWGWSRPRGENSCQFSLLEVASSSRPGAGKKETGVRP